MWKILLVLCISLTACDAVEQCEVPLQSMGKSMDDILVEDLKKAGIEFVLEENGRVCVSHKSADQVATIMHDIYVREIPGQYSDAISDPVRSMVVKALRDMKIPFQEKSFMDATYLVWSSEYDSLVRELIAKYDAQYSDKWFEEKSKDETGSE
ncbi:MAG: hypothetical protein P8171_17105 [Candidatus Thiodiazotropha sp.]